MEEKAEANDSYRQGGLLGSFPHLYPQVEALARATLARRGANASLSTHSLLSEAYLKLDRSQSLPFQNREHFMKVLAMVMRQILVNRFRAKQTQKRGGGVMTFPFQEELIAAVGRSLDPVAIHEALKKLGEVDPIAEQLVTLRFFCGFTEAEASEALGITQNQAKVCWRFSKVVLERILGDPRGYG